MSTTSPLRPVPPWTLSDRLWKARMSAGLTQQQLAQAIGISRKTVTNSETGTHRPLEPILRAWAEVTGVPLEWLKTGHTTGQNAPFRRTTDFGLRLAS